MVNLEAMLAERAEALDRFRITGTVSLRLVIAAATECTASGGGWNILTCGNGGSAADAQYFAAECMTRFEKTRDALAASALTTHASTLTAVSNDFGLEQVFARQVAALVRRGDVLFAMSTRGRSPNVLAAACRARAIGCTVVGFTGTNGGSLAACSDAVITVPSTAAARTREVDDLFTTPSPRRLRTRPSRANSIKRNELS